MKTVVIYRSKTGFTKKYAQWIAEVIGAELIDARNFPKPDFSSYDVVIYGGGLYAGGINGVKLIKRNLQNLTGKKVIVFASGATPNRDETTSELYDLNFSAEQQKTIKFFYLRGGFDFKRLGTVDKILMLLLKMKLKMKKASERTPDEKGMLLAYAAPCDFSKHKYIMELVNYAKGMEICWNQSIIL